jgi:hypothetical protein|tara:strand:- start:247 stop:417 length:171 start_codon:yes stop_codon:yes gene_type:complete
MTAHQENKTIHVGIVELVGINEYQMLVTINIRKDIYEYDERFFSIHNSISKNCGGL